MASIFDGTLAFYTSGSDLNELGAPIPEMVTRVKEWLARGVEVRIVTARVACCGQRNDDGLVDDQAFADEQRAQLEAWCEQHIGQKLQITAQKDFQMLTLYDDRCVRVQHNQGRLCEGCDFD